MTEESQKELRKQNTASHRWIPVGEKLPEETESTVTFNGRNGEVKLAVYKNGFFKTQAEKWIVYATHWLPIPSLPEPEKAVTR